MAGGKEDGPLRLPPATSLVGCRVPGGRGVWWGVTHCGTLCKIVKLAISMRLK